MRASGLPAMPGRVAPSPASIMGQVPFACPEIGRYPRRVKALPIDRPPSPGFGQQRLRIPLPVLSRCPVATAMPSRVNLVRWRDRTGFSRKCGRVRGKYQDHRQGGYDEYGPEHCSSRAPLPYRATSRPQHRHELQTSSIRLTVAGPPASGCAGIVGSSFLSDAQSTINP